MKRSIIESNLTGICTIDTHKVIKYWSLLCRVYDLNGTFLLVQFTPKGKRKLKIRISETDAYEIITQLNLKGIKSDIFKRDTAYLTVT